MEANTAPTSSDRRFLLFRAAERLYALPTDEVREVIRMPQIAAVPQSPKSLIGVANLHGTVVPVASLRALLGKGDGVANFSRAIVLAGDEPVAIAVDGVETFDTVAESQIERGQAVLAAEPGELLRGAFPSTARLGTAKILDVRSLLEAAFRKKSSKTREAGESRKIAAAQHVSETKADTRTLVTFIVSEQEFALALEIVSEIIELPTRLALVPSSEALVVGVISFRNSLLPLLSLRGLLGFDLNADKGYAPKVVVTAVRGIPLGLVVDGMRSIVRADNGLIDATPDLLAARTGGETKIAEIYRGEEGRRLISIITPDTLFREEVMEHLEKQMSHSVSRPSAPDSVNERQSQFLVFRLGDEEFCLPIGAVEEVAVMPDQVTRVPKTPKFVDGVVNLRGDVVPVIDQRHRLDLAKFAGEGRRRRLVIVRSGKNRAGLIVDSVSELLRVADSAIEPPPGIADDGTELVQGVINLPASSRMIMILDPGELLTPAEQDLLARFTAGAAKASK
jgi:purine-binding chemotaxis protein CheW